MTVAARVAPPARPTPERRAPFWPGALLLVAATAFYCAPLFGHLDHWGRRDWDQFTFRYETPRVALVRDHVWPTWNPYANGGTVLLAHADSPVLSPWYGIALLFGSPLGLRLQVAFFMALGAVGMAAFLSRLGISRAGGIAGGIVFMMSSHYALHVAEGHLEWTVLGLMPWLALGLLRLEKSVRWIILAALILASALTLGAVYVPAVYLPFFTMWMLLEAVRARRGRALARWMAVVVLAAGVSAAKLIPTLAFTSDHPREVEADQRTPRRWLLTALSHPRQAVLYQADRDRDLPDGHFAKTLSSADAAPLVDRLDRWGRPEHGFHEYGSYISAAGWLLAGLGGVLTFRRWWPLYGAGAFAGLVVLGGNAPIDLWAALRHLPLYGQFHVPSRFLAAVVFVLAVAAGGGLSALGERLAGRRGRWRRALEIVVIAILYAELAVMGRSLFSDVFVIPAVELPRHADFANRSASFAGEELAAAAMSSVMYPRLLSNSGVLAAYENVTVARGAVRAADDPEYRGEVFLDERRGVAELSRWTMSRMRIRVAVEAPDLLVLNQNFYTGWRGRRRTANGSTDAVIARANGQGLVAVPVEPQHTEVELFYVPEGFMAGLWISGASLALCLWGLRRW